MAMLRTVRRLGASMGDVPHRGERLLAAHQELLNQEAAKACLLLEYLSGRSVQAACTQGMGSKTQPDVDIHPDDSLIRQIDRDLADPTRLTLRTLRIAYEAAPHDASFAADAAFLVRARHCLNAAAAPANAVTIAYTAMVIGNRYRAGEETRNLANTAVRAYPFLQAEAARLHRSIRTMVRVLIAALALAVIVSAYTAWGKVMLDTMDAIRRDADAVRMELAAKTQDADKLCAASPDRPEICDRLDDIKRRFAVTIHHLQSWEWPFRGSPESLGLPVDSHAAVSADQARVPEWATSLVGVIGNYLMPSLYGMLGSIAFVLRRFHDKLGGFLLTPRDRSANEIRWVLGALIGSSIGLVYSSSSAAQTTGLLGAAVTLSTASIAFLAGYGVEGAFKALDALIVHLFRVSLSPRQEQAAG